MFSSARCYGYIRNGLGDYGYIRHVVSRFRCATPTPEWGAMIHEGKSYIRTNPELMLYPGLMIMLVVVTFNLLGEALSERFGVKRR